MLLKTCSTSFRIIPILLFFLLSASLLALGCAKPQVKLPLMSDPATGEYNEGKFVWFDLYTDDIAACALFYENLFGWSFEQVNTPNVQTIFRNNVPIANAIHTKPLKKEVKESRWLGFISVKDVDAVSRIIQESKGSLYLTPKDQPDRGRICVAVDPQGAIFGIVTAKGGDPIDQGLLENLWMGSELWTTHKDAAIEFYKEVAGYETKDISMEDFGQYTFLTKENIPRAGIVQITWEKIKPDWLPYIAVADVTAVCLKAEKFGGKILVEPDSGVKAGRVAIISDPSGAVFAVQQLPVKDVGEN